MVRRSGRSRVCLIAVGELGLRTALRAKSALGQEASLWAKRGLGGADLLFEDLRGAASRAWELFDALVFFSSCGVAVRAISGLPSSKGEDPAVLVVDELGRSAVSLLSGHLGGANELTLELAEALGAKAVITTTSDLKGLLLPDSMARAWGLELVGEGAVKGIAVSANLGLPVGLMVGPEVELRWADMPSSFVPLRWGEEVPPGLGGLVVVGERAFPGVDLPWVQLVPRSVVAGVGCRRGASAEAVRSALKGAFEEASLREESLLCIASADLKRGERSLYEVAAELSAELVFLPREGLREAGEVSRAALEVFGIPGVAEPAARALAPGGREILRRRVFDGVVISLFGRRVRLWGEGLSLWSG